MIPLEHGSVEEGRAWVGRTLADRPCEQPYDRTLGRLFCGLVEDRNPLYWDDELATARCGGPVVPAATLMSWSLPLPWRPDGRTEDRPAWARVPLPGDTIINVGTTTSYERPLRAAEVLTVREEVVSVSEEKRTSLGPGRFLTTRSTYVDADGALVAVHHNTLLRYLAAQEPVGPARREPASPGAPRDGTSFEIAVTRLRCALVVMGTLDVFPGHHDADYARRQGVTDTYVNTMFFQGVADRAATDSCEPGAHPRRRTLRMLRPAAVGETLVVAARVVPPVTGAGAVAEVDVSTTTGTRCAAATVEVAGTW